MAYNRATWLAKVLRDAGLHVVEHDGWKHRGLSTALPFTPKAVVWHHDASAKGASPGVASFMLNRFETAAAQIWVCLGCGGKHRIGTWHLLASGRAPHAGVTRPGAPTNFTSLGIETDHTTGEDWHPDLLRSLRVGTAAILRHLGRSAAKGLHFHKSICFPKGRKTDPAGLHLDKERERVGDLMAPKHRKPETIDALRVRVAARKDPSRKRGLCPEDVVVVERALHAEGLLAKRQVGGRFGKPTRRAYSRWQKRLGYSGADANGIPGDSSLRALGRKHGFRVEA